MRRGIAALGLAVAFAFAPRPVEAAEAAEGETGSFYDYWSDVEPRPFVSTVVGVGPLTTANVTLGYGKPHWMFVGVEAQGLATFEFVSMSGGLRAEFLLLNASFGVRQTWAFERRLPAPAAVFDDASLFDPTRPRSVYTTLDGVLYGLVPIGPTVGYWELTQLYFPGKSPNDAVFEEWTRVAVNDDTATMARLAWSYVFAGERANLGPAVDTSFSSGRDPIVRVGAAFGYEFTEHLGVLVYGSLPVATPDSIDWFTQSWGIARLSWKWASGESRPGL